MSLNKDNIEKYQIIKNHPAFEKLNYYMLKSISESITILNFRKNTFVIKENIDYQQNLYIVKHGEFQMTKKKPNNQKITRNNAIQICILIQGETFGLENFKDNYQQLYQYTVQCNSVSGQLFKLNLQELRTILINHCFYSPLSNLFNYPIQIIKNQIYQQREQQYIQNLQVNDSFLDYKQQEKKPINKIRSHSQQLTYTDKINIIIQGQRPSNNSKIFDNDSFDEDKYMHDSIMYNIRAMRSNLNESTKEDNLKRRNTLNTLEKRTSFIKNEDYKSKMKIMNQLGYKLKQKSYKKYYRLWQFKTIDSNDQLN